MPMMLSEDNIPCSKVLKDFSQDFFFEGLCFSLSGGCYSCFLKSQTEIHRIQVLGPKPWNHPFS